MGFRVVAVPAPALAWLEQRTGAVLTRQATGIAAVDHVMLLVSTRPKRMSTRL